MDGQSVPIGWLLKAFSVQRMQARMDEIHTEMVSCSNSEGNETCSDIVKQHYLLVPMAQLICYSCAIVASFLAAIKQNPRQKHGMLLTFKNPKKKEWTEMENRRSGHACETPTHRTALECVRTSVLRDYTLVFA